MTVGTRRLAAIMFTDLAGFTRLAQRDEETALRLRREHQGLLRPLFAEHRGREVKTMGDGFLVEFSSAVESVRCAVAIQRAMAQRNVGSPPDQRILLRVGVHIGDVVEEDGDILGDAVNVASRIEPLAEPGGICVSGSVFEQVRNKLSVPFERLEARTLKNVDHPVDLYRVVLSGEVPPSKTPTVEPPSSLRLAVLPLASLSQDPGDEYFADGLTDELISRASQIPNLRVIAQTSVRRYKGASKSLREVGQELGVSVALEGSVRKAGDRVRITVRLVDTRSEEHLWSSRYDRPFDDIFAIQDDIAGQIANSITVHIAGPSATLPTPPPAPAPDTRDMEAYSTFLHARKLFGEKGSEATIRHALSLFEEAVRRDPNFARARVGIAESVLWLATEGAAPYAEAVDRARAELGMALRQNDALAEAHTTLAGLFLGDDRFVEAEHEARRAMELNPSLSDPYRWLAQLRAGDGQIVEAVRLLETAFQLDPMDVNVIAFLGRAYAYAGRDEDALSYWKRTEPFVPFRTNAHRTEYFLGRGEDSKAHETLEEMERLRPDSIWTETYRAILAIRRGDTETARNTLERFRSRADRGDLTVFHQGFVHYALGEEDAFVTCMEEAFRLHALPLLELMYSPLFETARHDPRIIDLLRRQSELHQPSK
jgi:TolB-like protein/class 3 adenylate cyclase